MKEQRHIRRLNQELENERKGKIILNTIITIFVTFTIVGPLVMIVLLNSEWIDKVFGYWQVQLIFLLFPVLLGSFMYLKWKIKEQ